MNITAAIELYKNGQIDGVEQVFTMHGKVVEMDKVFESASWSWSEGILHQFSHKFAYGHGPFGRKFHEVILIDSIYFIMIIV